MKGLKYFDHDLYPGRCDIGFLAVAIVLALAMPATAPAAPLQLYFDLTRKDALTSSSETITWGGFASIQPIFSPDLLSYSLKRPDGVVASEKTSPTANVGHGFSYPTFAAMTAALSGSWTLDVTTTLGTSTYSLVPNLTTVPESAYVTTQMLAPAPGAEVSPKPTFSWLPSRSYEYGYSYSNWDGSSTNSSLSYGQPQSWIPAVSLPTGSARFAVQLMDMTNDSVPLTATRISGVDQGVFTSAKMFESYTFLPYKVVVPEPQEMLWLFATTILCWRRRRSRASF